MDNIYLSLSISIRPSFNPPEMIVSYYQCPTDDISTDILPIASQIVKASGIKTCSRPNCEWPHEASDDNEDFFFVESIIGRSVVNEKKPGRKKIEPLWLVKWQGSVDIASFSLVQFTKLNYFRYHIKECDWLVEEAIGTAAGQFIGEFLERAREEGIKVVDDNSVYLLKEARSQVHIAIKERWKWAAED